MSKVENKIIITSAPKSGTAYMSRLLSEAGIECTHEGYFTPKGIKLPIETPAESSWLAVPFLSFLTDTTKIHIIRDPLKVINSMRTIKFLTRDNIFDEFARKILPALPTIENEIDRLLYFYIQWLGKASDNADFIFSIEGITERPEMFFKMIKREPSNTDFYKNTKCNTAGGGQTITLGRLKKSIYYPFFEEIVKKNNQKILL